MKAGLILTVLLSILSVSKAAKAEVSIGGRHVYILYPGVDAVWGSYIFTITNNGSAPERFRFPVLLPKETIDFQGQDSITAAEMKLGADGSVTIDKEFQPGENMMQVGFKVPAGQGKGVANFKLPYDVDSLGFFVWQNGIVVEGDRLEVQKGLQLSDRIYDAYSFTQSKAGASLTATFVNIPVGRGLLWWIGWTLGGVMVALGFGLAYTSRPKNLQVEDSF